MTWKRSMSMTKLRTNYKKGLFDELLEVLDYSPEEGSFTWNKRMGARALKGQQVNLKLKKRPMVRTGGVEYSLPLVIYYFYTGKLLPRTHLVTFLDGDFRNLKLNNLAIRTRSDFNSLAAPYGSIPKVGIKELDGRYYTACLKQTYLGCFKTIEEAVAARQSAERFGGIGKEYVLITGETV